jgi:hypothetical protein
MIMRNIVSRLILWLAEILDRNLVTVPDIDLYDDGGCHPQRPAFADFAS